MGQNPYNPVFPPKKGALIRSVYQKLDIIYQIWDFLVVYRLIYIQFQICSLLKKTMQMDIFFTVDACEK